MRDMKDCGRGGIESSSRESILQSILHVLDMSCPRSGSINSLAYGSSKIETDHHYTKPRPI